MCILTAFQMIKQKNHLLQQLIVLWLGIGDLTVTISNNLTQGVIAHSPEWDTRDLSAPWTDLWIFKTVKARRKT